MSYAGDPGDDSGSFLAQQGQVTPDSIQRQLALAAALQQQSQHINPGGYGGLNSAIQNIGGALLNRQATQAQAQRYAQVMKSLFGDGQAAPAPQPSQAQNVAAGQLDPEGNPIAATAPQPSASPQVPAGGPLASALGPSRAALYASLLQAEGPGQGMALLPKMVEEAANRQQAQQLLAQLTGQPGTGAPPAQMPPQNVGGPQPAAVQAAAQPPPQQALGMPAWQQRGLAMAAMGGDPNAVIKQAMTYNQPFDLDGVKYAWGADGQATPIVNPKQTIDIPRSQFKELGIDPNSVPSTTQIEFNPITRQFTKNELGDIKSPVAQQQAIQAAAARATALMNAQVPADAVQGAVDYFKATGQLPPNARSPAMQVQVLKALENEGAGGGSAFGQGAETKIGLHAQQGAATNLAKQQAGTQVNEDTVNGAMNILNGLLAKGAAGPSNITGVNDLSVWARQHTNDPDAANLVNGIGAISNEYARVMTGTTSGSPSSDSARNEAATRIMKGYNSGTMQAVMAQMQQEMANRSIAQRGALSQATHGAYTGVTPTIQYNAPAKGKPTVSNW